MSDSFTLNFLYKGVAEEIPCSLRVSRFTYQFLCTLDGTDIIIEKDDEGNLRVMEAEPFSNKSKRPDALRIKAIMDELERILKETKQD
jgi:hypothetical protein